MPSSRYELLVQVAASLRSTDLLTNDRELTADEMAGFLDANRDCLARARSALGPDCVVPLQYDQEFFSRHVEDFQALRCLARAMAAAVDKSRAESDNVRAVEGAIDLFDLANATRRGGLVVDALVGNAIAGLAIDRARQFRFHLDPHAASQLARELVRIDGEREPFADILARDRDWERVVDYHEEPMTIDEMRTLFTAEAGVDDEAAEVMASTIHELLIQPPEETKAFQIQLDQQSVALIRLLAIEAGLIAYHGLHGTYPTQLSQIVSETIPALPQDPFTSADFKFNRTGDRYVLYSPGPTGRDSGGMFGHWFNVIAGDADLCLDLFDFELGCSE